MRTTHRCTKTLFEFRRNWQPTHLTIDIAVAPIGKLEIVIENDDGTSISCMLFGERSGANEPNRLLPLLLLTQVVVAIRYSIGGIRSENCLIHGNEIRA